MANTFYIGSKTETLVTGSNIELVMGSATSYDPNDNAFKDNNFTLSYSTSENGTFVPLNKPYRVFDNIFYSTGTEFNVGYYQLEVQANYSQYSYIGIDEIINNFSMMYVGIDKVAGKVKRQDILFHAKRALQEFSYDILKVTKNIELEVPHTLKLSLPPDYVSSAAVSVIDDQGLKRPLYTNIHKASIKESPIQDDQGIPVQDSDGEDIQAESISDIMYSKNFEAPSGRNYNSPGLDPYMSNSNGFYLLEEDLGSISFSSDLVGETILIEYISDSLAYERDMRVPKLAEEAIYAYILSSIIHLKPNIPEYIVKRYSKEKIVRMRNAKIRLSNININELTQVMRGRSKMIKH